MTKRKYVSKGNTAKYLSYRYAHSRAKQALENKFYLEAICLYESMLADRLLSFISHVAPEKKVNLRMAFGILADKVEECANEKDLLDANHTKIVVGEIRAWIQSRNACVHSVAKSAYGQPTVPVEQFIATAEKTALDGKKLFGRVKAWHGKEKRNWDKKIKS
jgi:hypothetical protein